MATWCEILQWWRQEGSFPKPSKLNGLSVCHTSGPCKNGWTDRDAVWFEDSGGLREPCIIDGVRSPIGRRILGKGTPIVKYRTFCRELCKNRWTDRFAVCVVDSDGPKEAQLQPYSPGCQVAPMCPQMRAKSKSNVAMNACNWRIRLNHPSAAAMRPGVKLLSPLVTITVS